MLRSPGILPITLAALLGLAAAPALADERADIDKVNGSITAAAGQAYDDLTTVNGEIRLEAGTRAGEATTVNGSIDIAANATLAQATTVNGGIHLDDNVQVEHDLGTVNGGIFVGRGGQVGGDITTVNGAIGLVDTDLAGGIVTVSGDITVGIGSHVHGGITVEEAGRSWLPINFGTQRVPRIVIGPEARVDGPLQFKRKVRLYVHDSARVGEISGASAIPYSGARAPGD